MLLKKGDSCGEQVSQDQRPCRHQHKENKVEIFFSDIAGKGNKKKKKFYSMLGTVELLFWKKGLVQFRRIKVETEVANFRQLDYESYVG